MSRRQWFASLLAILPVARKPALSELDPSAATFEADCETVAAQFVAEIGEPRLADFHELIVAAVRSAAGTGRDALSAIADGMAVLPYTEPRLAQFSRDVMDLKAARCDHELFHVPSGTPLADILPLFDGHTWTMLR